MGEKVIFRAKYLSVYTWRLGPDICCLICVFTARKHIKINTGRNGIFFWNFFCNTVRKNVLLIKPRIFKSSEITGAIYYNNEGSKWNKRLKRRMKDIIKWNKYWWNVENFRNFFIGVLIDLRILVPTYEPFQRP